eukprot:10677662-Alexandrium_andersonii.AAC.1
MHGLECPASSSAGSSIASSGLSSTSKSARPGDGAVLVMGSPASPSSSSRSCPGAGAGARIGEMVGDGMG